MAGKAGDDIKGSDILKAFVDLVILVLLMIGSGFGGYWYGIHERLAPVKNVAPGTPGALPPSAVTPAPPGAQPPATTPTATTPVPATTTSTTATPTAPATTASGKKQKFWLLASGSEYIGYNITVSVNGEPVDSFYGGDKMIDITKRVRHGENTITFDAKSMPEINKHKGQSSAMLTLQLVHGPKLTDEPKSSDVVLSYTRNAAQTENDTKDLTFTDGD